MYVNSTMPYSGINQIFSNYYGNFSQNNVFQQNNPISIFQQNVNYFAQQPQQQDNSSGFMSQMMSMFLPMLMGGNSRKSTTVVSHSNGEARYLKSRIEDLQAKMNDAEANRAANANWLMVGGPATAGTTAYAYLGKYQAYEAEKKDLEARLEKIKHRH